MPDDDTRTRQNHKPRHPHRWLPGDPLRAKWLNETRDSVVKIQGGLAETIPRDQIAKMETNGQSLMPVGLEAAISKQEMADLIAFLKAR